jgi:hypothetical protein
VLREVEGRSHREVAHAMEISPSQAKALIHRAKGSFRRHWLEKVAERGGFMGLAFLPLLWLARFGNGLRRVVDRVGSTAQVAQAAAPEAVTQTVTAVTATAAPAATGMAERLVAAGVTILVAGSVTVGAAKIVTDNDQAKTVGEVAAAAIAPAVSSLRSSRKSKATEGTVLTVETNRILPDGDPTPVRALALHRAARPGTIRRWIEPDR